MKIEKIITISLQDEAETKEAIEFNKVYDYEYKIIADNLIKSDQVSLLVRNGYIVINSNSGIALLHKTQLKEKTK